MSALRSFGMVSFGVRSFRRFVSFGFTVSASAGRFRAYFLTG